MATPKFATVSRSFHTELKQRVNKYFTEAGQSFTGNSKLYTKAIVLFSAFIFLYIHLVFYTPATPWALLECV